MAWGLYLRFVFVATCHPMVAIFKSQSNSEFIDRIVTKEKDTVKIIYLNRMKYLRTRFFIGDNSPSNGSQPTSAQSTRQICWCLIFDNRDQLLLRYDNPNKPGFRLYRSYK